ncbi:hypothetical protein [Luteimonas sp. MC1572]|nr:hypothetical protein [Luteimonas sp. MC1572]
MRYVDGSKSTADDLKVMGATGTNMHTDGRLIHVGVEADAGHGLTAGNMGLNPYDVAVGFSRGRDIDAAHTFSGKVIARLEKHWTVKVVPKDSGAFPNPECAQGTAAPPNNSFKPTPLRGAA